MGVLLALAVGYVVGARAGQEEFDEVVRAIKELRESQEVRDLLSALRNHVAHTLRSSAGFLEQAETPASELATDLVDRVRVLMKRS